ncbi:MAG TPA: thioredoxin domain-containing protein [Gaiellaceae bacterium]|jgi:protein-disulfide isomerase|nr:thioredoxin domain-containing protein [Gaiellaceae bacterium]
MPSGKKSKQLRRAAQAVPPPVTSKGSGRTRQASPRVLIAGAGGVAVVVVVVVLAIVLSGGGGSGSGVPKSIQTYGSLASGLPGASDVQAMFKGISQKGLDLGSPFAPVQMVIFIDLQCPICQEFETTVSPTLVSKYVRTGKVRIHVEPWAFIGPDSYRGQDAMFAAAMQNKAFNFAQVLYDNQRTENTGWLTDSMIYQIAVSVPGLNVPKLLSDRKSAEVKKEASNVAALADVDHVTGTPTVYVGKNGTKPKLVGSPGSAPDLQQVTLAIDTALLG